MMMNSNKSSKGYAPPHPSEEYEAAISRAIEESLRAEPLFDGYDHDFFFPRMHKEPPARNSPINSPVKAGKDHDGQGSADDEMKQAVEDSLSLERAKKTRIALQHLHGLLGLDLHANSAFAPYYTKVKGLYGLTPEVAQAMLYWSVVFEPTLGPWEAFAASEAFSMSLRVLPLSATHTSRNFICTPEVAGEIALRQARRKERQQGQQRPEVGQGSASASGFEEEEENEEQEEEQGQEQEFHQQEEEQDYEHPSESSAALDGLEQAREQRDPSLPPRQSSPPEEEEMQEDVQYNPPPQQNHKPSHDEEQQIEQEEEERGQEEKEKDIAKAGNKNKNKNKNSCAPAPAVPDPSALPPKDKLMGGYVVIDVNESDTDGDGPIAECDPTGCYGEHFAGGDVPVAEAILVDSASASFMEDETDAVLVDAHDLLSPSALLQFQEMLRSESEEYLQSLCVEHERDVLYSSVVFHPQHPTAIPVPDASSDLKSDPILHVDEDTPSECTLTCPNPEVFHLLKQNQMSFLLEFGVKLFFPKSSSSLKVKFASPDRDVLEIARGKLQEIFANPSPLQNHLSLHQTTRTHIFIDNSNIFIGAQVEGIDPRKRQFIRNNKARLDISKLHNLVNNGRKSVTRYVCGSLMNTDGEDAPWVGVYKRAGYKVNAISIGANGKEGGIDSALIAQFYEQGFNVCDASERNVLILLTGDGNSNGGNASFFSAVKKVIDKGAFVELWCWRLSMSNNYRRLANEMCNTGQFKVFYLDQYRDEIVYSV